MTNVIIHGELGAIYGKTHKFEVKRLLDVTKALNANNPGFKDFIISKFMEGFDYVFVDPQNPNKKWKTAEQLQEASAPSEIHIVPSIGGAGAVAGVVAAVVSTVATAAAALGTFLVSGGFLANLALGLLIQGVMSLLFPVELPKVPTQEVESKIDQSSYLFTNLQNNVVQGFPVPLLYGELRVGSNIIGTDVISEDLG
jgi:predicted phage tail protein|tara:strand:+ start:2817 stop:3410 length:594 start_codon:yes stop_codon:yes gene_type:complete